MYLAKTDDDDPDRVRPPQRGNDERRIGQGKKVVLGQSIAGQFITE